MTLLNTPMPAYDCKELIEDIMGSNSMIKVEGFIYFRGKEKGTFSCFLGVRNYPSWTFYEETTMKITSITPIIPKYEIGQKVLILSTGEMKTVTEVSEYGNIQTGFVDGFEQFYHRSEICKLPNDL